MTLRHIFRSYSGSLCNIWWRSMSPVNPTFQISSCVKKFSSSLIQVDVNANDIQDLSEEKKTSIPVKKKRRKKTKIGESESGKDKVGDLSKYNSTARTIIKYIDDNNETKGLWESLTRYDLKQGKLVPKVVYLTVKKYAEKFALAIKAENPDIMSPVLEVHAGLGLLTEQLLNNVGFKYVTCMEDRLQLRISLTERFNVGSIDLSMNGLPRSHHLDKLDGGDRIHTFLKEIKYDKNEERKRDLYIVGTMPNIGSINFLIRSMTSRRIFFEDDPPWSNVTLFVAFGTKVHLICTATPEDGLVVYRATTILFNTLFKYKEIAVIPRKAFVPWEIHIDKDKNMGLKAPKLRAKDPDNMHVYKIEVNQETVEKVGRENLFNYFYFVRHHLFARTNRVIPELEKWVPGCGTRLIRQGYDIFSQIGKLSPHQVLDLYMEFVSWPEFANSSFLNAVEKYQTRVELLEDDEDSALTATNRDFHGEKK